SSRSCRMERASGETSIVGSGIFHMEYTEPDIRCQLLESHHRHRQPAAAGDRRLGADLAPQRFLEPGHVPVAAELASLLGVVRRTFEAEPLVQLNRRRVGEGDADVRTMHVFAL